MSTNLDDLKTNNVGWIAYYNVLDNTSVTDVSPSETASLVSDNDNISYFDNGVVVNYNGPTRSEYIIRFKNDGWITAHMKRANVNNAGNDGVHDIVDWTKYRTGSLKNNVLERSIKNALSQLSNWSSIQSGYKASEVGLYNYEYETSNVTLLSEDARDAGDGSYNIQFQYTQETNVARAVAAGKAESYDSEYAYVDSITDGSYVVDNSSSSPSFGTLDITDTLQNTLSAGDAYKIKIGKAYGVYEASVDIVVLWS
jgi:hypothetical protein